MFGPKTDKLAAKLFLYKKFKAQKKLLVANLVFFYNKLAKRLSCDFMMSRILYQLKFNSFSIFPKLTNNLFLKFFNQKMTEKLLSIKPQMLVQQNT